MAELTIHDMAVEERPRERLARCGPSALSNAELVAILLGSGIRGRSALSLAQDLVARGLGELSRQEVSSLACIPGVGPAKGSRLAAALELGRRAASTPQDRESLRNVATLAKRLVATHSHHIQERLGAVYLDTRDRIIREREIYVGTVNATTVSTRDVLRWALLDGALSVIVFHNHPSGDPAPSAEDLIFTRKLEEAGQTLGIRVRDHIIIGVNRYVSMRERGLMK
ncbi:MAG: DNA repair protein RadC [Acidobacteria bacterium]|nr:DNA repair protein RadC [Acidobacteriota bacterium]